MVSRSCHVGVEVLVECGGGWSGTCNHTTGSCVCFDGWSGGSDLIPLDLTRWANSGPRVTLSHSTVPPLVLACPVHIPTLKVLWGIVALGVVLCVWKLPAAMVEVVRVHRRMWKRRRKNKERIRRKFSYSSGAWYQWAVLFAVLVCAPAFVLLTAALAVLKLASDGNSAAIGVDLLPSALFVLVQVRE